MNNIYYGQCPACSGELRVNRLQCSHCKAEYPTNQKLSPFERLSAEQESFLITFLKCKGNISAVEQALNISYPTVKKRYNELLVALGLKEEEIIEKGGIDMSIFGKIDRESKKPSEIIKAKLFDNNGTATVRLQRGEACRISIAKNGNAFESDKLGNQFVEFSVFDLIVEFLKSNGGKAPKGMGRNDRVGYGKCGPETVMYQIATQYYGKRTGESTFDPVFVLACSSA